jgi:hypothetical protein
VDKTGEVTKGEESICTRLDSILLELCSLPPPLQICNHSAATFNFAHIAAGIRLCTQTNCNGGINNRYIQAPAEESIRVINISFDILNSDASTSLVFSMLFLRQKSSHPRRASTILHLI